MIVRARTVVTMDGPPLEDGAIAIEGNKIADVGPWKEVRSRHAGTVTDLGESILFPGLINAHCHLDYTLFRGAIPARASFTQWIQSINERKASLTPEDYQRSIAAGLAEAASFGTTTIANLEAFPDLIPRKRSVPMRTWWFAEMIDVRERVRPPVVLAKLKAKFEHGERLLGGVGLAPHAPYTASSGLYAETAELAERKSIPVTTHLAESEEEMQMFRHGRGALFDFMRSIGRPMNDCGQATPLGLMVSREILDERWIVAHVNELTPEDFRLLEHSTRFHVAHSPRSHAYFGHSPFALKKLRALGFNICLGTDSLASNQDLSLFAEMRMVRETDPALRSEEILEMVTVNGALALGQAESLGQIRIGFLADLAAIPVGAAAGQAAEEILFFDKKTPWRMVNGEVCEGANE